MTSPTDGLRCRECGRLFGSEARYVCEWCFGPLEVVYDYDAISGRVDRARIGRGPLSIWRYADLLPADPGGAVDLGAGYTPLIRADRLAAELGLGELWLKDDTRNPTGSFKDRVTSVALTAARARFQGGGLRLDGEPRQLRRGARGPRRHGVLRLRAD